MVESHYKKQLDNGLDFYGSDTTFFWLSSLSTYTGRPLNDITRPEHIPQRAYLDRYVDAPYGATLYWDMPSVVAVLNLSKISHSGKYRKAVERYIMDFMSHCKAKNGVFLWGNHYYYDVYMDTAVKFGSSPTPVNFGKRLEITMKLG